MLTKAFTAVEPGDNSDEVGTIFCKAITSFDMKIDIVTVH